MALGEPPFRTQDCPGLLLAPSPHWLRWNDEHLAGALTWFGSLSLLPPRGSLGLKGGTHAQPRGLDGQSRTSRAVAPSHGSHTGL